MPLHTDETQERERCSGYNRIANTENMRSPRYRHMPTVYMEDFEARCMQSL